MTNFHNRMEEDGEIVGCMYVQVKGDKMDLFFSVSTLLSINNTWTSKMHFYALRGVTVMPPSSLLAQMLTLWLCFLFQIFEKIRRAVVRSLPYVEQIGTVPDQFFVVVVPYFQDTDQLSHSHVTKVKVQPAAILKWTFFQTR